MNINHIAVWADNIELLKDFYCRWFGATTAPQYHNPRRRLTSYFLTFPTSGVLLEIMNEPDIMAVEPGRKLRGFCHIAMSVGSKEAVDDLTESMRSQGVPVLGNPRTTGEGLYESVVADPEGNTVELTV